MFVFCNKVKKELNLKYHRLTNLSIIHIERDLSYEIKLENLLNIFAEKDRHFSLINLNLIFCFMYFKMK